MLAPPIQRSKIDTLDEGTRLSFDIAKLQDERSLALVFLERFAHLRGECYRESGKSYLHAREFLRSRELRHKSIFNECYCRSIICHSVVIVCLRVCNFPT